MIKIQAENIEKRFPIKANQRIYANSNKIGEIQVLKDLNLSIKKGEFITIVGPSGCGKSVFLDMVGGLTKMSSGNVFLDGKKVNGSDPQVGYVFQQYALLPWRTAISNIEYPLEIRGIEPAKRKEKAKKLISLIGLNGFDKWLPYQLSGGMQQRVAIARSLSTDPEVLLMDEPFAALDAQTRELLQEELLRIWEGIRNTVIFVTHSIEEAIFLADRVVVMTARPGRVKHIIDIHLSRPRGENTRASKEFGAYRHKIWAALKDEVNKAQKDWKLFAGNNGR
ncbi:ABC transporter ATP-binding protein [Clostridium kluyveri]|uniref:ABC transporter ATP-binding protein n=1 Tax=Clostridium kluyveri TaxID=1534 RepID=A0A1L5F7E1_CLOKL|nr:ABC transporter ATP-binding protein [Clostridium kluyveri]APM38938.1 ABC transporter ATP-binding protein [Clostridium kluyveri]UZQ51260.1 ABC transporter ATP-binding protein [Clostridium kluyveri]